MSTKNKQHKVVKEWEMFTALDTEGFYWDERIGKCYYPEVFVNVDSAAAHAMRIGLRWNITVKVVSLIIKRK